MDSDRMTQRVDALAEAIYRNSAREFGFEAPADVAASDKCHTLTLDLARALRNKGIAARRELHATPDYGYWHYVVAYGAKPSPDEIITDMNPALDLMGMPPRHFHGPRSELQRILRAQGASDSLVALRGIQTVVMPHTMDLLPPFYGMLRESYIKELGQSSK